MTIIHLLEWDIEDMFPKCNNKMYYFRINIKYVYII